MTLHIVKLFLTDPGIDINARDVENWIALNAASIKNFQNAFNLLLISLRNDVSKLCLLLQEKLIMKLSTL